MKNNIHPQYHPKAKIICGCGKVWVIGSTQESMKVEICAACHPFFTGEEKYVDTMGRVERFERMVTKTKEKQAALKPKKPRKTK